MPFKNHPNCVRKGFPLVGLVLMTCTGTIQAATPQAESTPPPQSKQTPESAQESTPAALTEAESRGHPLLFSNLGISSNPSATYKNAGTGQLARWLGLKRDWGIFIGGFWESDANYLIAGGKDPRNWTLNSNFVASLGLDTEKLFGWKGGRFGIEFLQGNTQDSNEQAGSVQGYDSLPAPEPRERTELLQLWASQELFDGKLRFRIGKMVPTADFNNVVRPVVTDDPTLAIPGVSGLGYTPIFKNPTLIGVMGSSYNSTCGVTVTLAPTKTTYLSYGLYDGNIVNRVNTGMTGPQFNGYYFNIWEAGFAWELGPDKLPGNVGVGLWHQTGILRGKNAVENGANGVYLFGSQRLWFQHPGVDNSGVSAFYQFGANDSSVLYFNQYFGMGFTGFGLVPTRPKDSLGAGMAWSWLNNRVFNRSSELMFQGYYQAHIVGGLYVQPAMTFIPTPGGGSDLKPAWAGTLRVTLLF
ncbi:carbohydrate porin [soil metagenome]